MEQHPIPRQITSFEFKLVGFLTVKQFIYLLIFIGAGFAVYLVFPIPVLNILLAILVAALGGALAFLPVNDRPLDVWLKNLFKRLTSPTQYRYKKNNPPPISLMGIPSGNSGQVSNHIDSQKKLNAYMGNKNTPLSNAKKQNINNLISSSLSVLSGKKPDQAKPAPKASPSQASTVQMPKKPFFTGIIKNHKDLPLYGIMVYVKKNENDTALRILKTNVNGVFASFKPLESGEYFFQIKDPQGTYFFDTMKIEISEANPQPIHILSKELI